MVQRMAAEREQAKLTAEAPDGQFSWKRDDEYITYQVRNKSRFIGTLRKVELDKDEGIFAKVGQLKPEYIPEGGNPKTKVVQTVIFDLQNGWTLAKAKAWIGERQLSAMELVIAVPVPIVSVFKKLRRVVARMAMTSTPRVFRRFARVPAVAYKKTSSFSFP